MLDSSDLDQAVVSGCVESVRKLLSCSTTNPSSSYNSALWHSVDRRNVDIVKALLADPRVDPNDRRGFIMYEAIRQRMIEISLLLVTHPRFDPACDRHGAIFWAADYDVAEVVRVLLDDPRVDATGAIEQATGTSRLIMAAHDTWGICNHRALYEKWHPLIVEEYDAMLSRSYTMAFVAKQLPTWSDAVEPVAKRLKASFIL